MSAAFALHAPSRNECLHALDDVSGSLLGLEVLVKHNADVSGADSNGEGHEGNQCLDLLDGGLGVCERVRAEAGGGKGNQDQKQGEEGAHRSIVSLFCSADKPNVMVSRSAVRDCAHALQNCAKSQLETGAC